VWALDSPIPSAQRNMSQDSAKSKATRHLDSPTDGGLEYLMPGNPQWPYLNHSLQFKYTLHLLVRNIRDGRDSFTESWLDIAQTMDLQQDLSSRSQDEIVKSDKPIEDPVRLFGQFVSAVTSDALKDIQLRSEVS